MPKAKQPLSTTQELFVRMSAQGKSRTEILEKVFGLDIETASENEIHAADNKMSRWRKHPDFESTWKDEVRQILYGCTAEAVQVIKSQLRSGDLPWLQNKAANDLLNYGKGQIYGEEDRAVHIKIEGMPDLGSPDQEE
jgi:hypothetical protein